MHVLGQQCCMICMISDVMSHRRRTHARCVPQRYGSRSKGRCSPKAACMSPTCMLGDRHECMECQVVVAYMKAVQMLQYTAVQHATAASQHRRSHGACCMGVLGGQVRCRVVGSVPCAHVSSTDAACMQYRCNTLCICMESCMHGHMKHCACRHGWLK
jgi:hypothetical protein